MKTPFQKARWHHLSYSSFLLVVAGLKRRRLVAPSSHRETLKAHPHDVEWWVVDEYDAGLPGHLEESFWRHLLEVVHRHVVAGHWWDGAIPDGV